MELQSSWFNPSGGVVYHWLAYRHRHRMWENHRREVAAWLGDWQPSSDELLLVGPSAGYCLPDSFLQSFSRLRICEPDPLARWLLRRRFPRAEIVATDYLLEGKVLRQNGLAAMRREFPHAAVLFCNVLGQLGLLAKASEADWRHWRQGLEQFCRHGEWASFHDLWSTNTHPREVLSWPDSASPAGDGLKASIAHFGYADGSYVIHDHLTSNWFSGRFPRRQWLWQLQPNETHCIEGVRASKQEVGA